jgi:hypothetical protein
MKMASISLSLVNRPARASARPSAAGVKVKPSVLFHDAA